MELGTGHCSHIRSLIFNLASMSNKIIFSISSGDPPAFCVNIYVCSCYLPFQNTSILVHALWAIFRFNVKDPMKEMLPTDMKARVCWINHYADQHQSILSHLVKPF